MRIALSTVRHAAALVSLCLLGCSDRVALGGESTPPESRVRWAVPSVLAPTGSLVVWPEATDSIAVSVGALEVAAHRVADGSLLWKRSNIATLMPMIVGDSMFVAMSAGESAAMRLRDGAVLWRSAVPGQPTSIRPVEIAGYGLTADGDGTVYALSLASGAVRTLATMQALAGGAGNVWAFVAAGGDTLLTLSQLSGSQGRGAIVLTRLLVSSGQVVTSVRVPFAASEFLTTDLPFEVDSLLVLPIAGGALAVNARTGARVWKVMNNSVSIVLRDGLLYSGSGNSSISVLDARTGSELRKLDLGVPSAILRQYVCREGIYFIANGMYVVKDAVGAKSERVFDEPDYLFSFFSQRGSTVYSSSAKHNIALRCT